MMTALVKTNLEVLDIPSIIEKMNLLSTDTVLVVIDVNILRHYENDFSFSSQIKNKRVLIWKAIDGEKTKTFSEYQQCLEFFIEKGIHRNSHLIAIGGGATSDFAGFVASTLLRGIAWSVIPTTLLSMVDASIGGKVAINSKTTKNLIGQFHLPQNVWIHLPFLNSLSQDEMISGKGEIAKYAMLDKDIFDAVVGKRDLKEIILKCAEYKKNLTEKDFKESGDRAFLNLGHSFGHAFEKIFNIPHGVAVVWGMAVIFKVFMSGQCLKELEDVLENLGWATSTPPWFNKNFPTNDVMFYVSKDKKLKSDEEIELIVLDKVGGPKKLLTQLDSVEKKLVLNENNLRGFRLRGDIEAF